MNKHAERLKAFIQKDSALMVISIILAVIIWFIISVTQYPTTEKTFTNIPIRIELDGTFAQSQNLDITSQSVQTVNVRISGERRDVGNIRPEDLTAEADVTGVMNDKKYDLPLNIVCAKDSSFEVVSIEPSSVSVVFDRIVTRTFDVEPLLDNVKVASGYLLGDAVVTPATVSITGPQDLVTSITKVCAKVTTDKELNSTYEFTTSDLVLYNNNAIISDDEQRLSFDKTSAAVQVPVHVRRTIGLTVNIINAPENFDLQYFRDQLVFSQDKLDIAAPDGTIMELESLNIGTINMREVDVGSVFTFSTENFLPDGYENLSQVNTITVTCPSEGITKKPVAIMCSDIQFVNNMTQYKYTPVATGMTLYLVGDENDINEMSSEDITAQVNLLNLNSTIQGEGDYKMPVDFIISSYTHVWFNGEDGVATPKIYVTATYIGEDEAEQDYQ